MDRFEYKIEEGKLTADQLNELGKEGWELVSVTSTLMGGNAFYFKRKILKTFKV